MHRQILLTSSIAAGIVLTTTPAPALIPVEDYGAITRIWEGVQVAQKALTEAQNTARAVTSVPRNLMSQVEGLLSMGVQNPLGDLQNTLSSIMHGGPLSGSCAAAAGNIISATRYATASGSDFSGILLNANSSRLGGVVSCMDTQLRSTQSRLNQMPQLLEELQNCQDVSCTTAVSGRIQLETATIGAQTNQAILMGQAAQAQRWATEDQVNEKIRRDAEETIQGTSGQGAGGSPVAARAMTTEAPTFAATTASGG